MALTTPDMGLMIRAYESWVWHCPSSASASAMASFRYGIFSVYSVSSRALEVRRNASVCAATLLCCRTESMSASATPPISASGAVREKVMSAYSLSACATARLSPASAIWSG